MDRHDYWLNLPTTKDKNPRTRNGGDLHIKIMASLAHML